nr:MAG TPA: hypothetical protein [Caudoviricetes sp.]
MGVVNGGGGRDYVLRLAGKYGKLQFSTAADSGATTKNDLQGGNYMARIQDAPRYTFRPGALDHIMRSRNLHSDDQLAAFIGCRVDDLAKLRAGYPVTARLALKVSALQGDRHYIAGYFDPVEDAA